MFFWADRSDNGPMRFVFNQQKAAEAAAHLLEMAGGSMEYIRLIKLMYLADRQTLIDIGTPITGDNMVSMPHGPVLSRVYDRIAQRPEGPPWSDYVSAPNKWGVSLVEQPPSEGALSNFEISVLRGIHEEWKGVATWDMVAALHELPEFTDPNGSALPIDPVVILRHAGKSDQEVAARIAEAETVWSIDRLGSA